MGSKICVGILFENTSWTGGTYYCLNLIHSLNYIDKDIQPEIVLLSKDSNDLEYVKKETGYEKISIYNCFPKYNFFEKVVNKIYKSLFNKKLFDKRITEKIVDCILPIRHNFYGDIFDLIPKKIFWIPDFQEHFLPNYFETEGIKSRKIFQTSILYSKANVIVSSNTSFKELLEIFPGFSAKVNILRFAVKLPELNNANFNTVKTKYNLPEKFYFSPNQFWIHKNHIIILKALRLSIKNNNPIHAVFTGNLSDNRNKDYLNNLKKFIDDNDLQPYIHILGFIDRVEQLSIMSMSEAVIQPSLFEGWSTVVEDAKSLNKKIICSDLKVHQEQLEEKGLYFKPNDPESLLNCLEISKTIQEPNFNYADNLKTFGKSFYTIIHESLS